MSLGVEISGLVSFIRLDTRRHEGISKVYRTYMYMYIHLYIWYIYNIYIYFVVERTNHNMMTSSKFATDSPKPFELNKLNLEEMFYVWSMYHWVIRDWPLCQCHGQLRDQSEQVHLLLFRRGSNDIFPPLFAMGAFSLGDCTNIFPLSYICFWRHQATVPNNVDL